MKKGKFLPKNKKTTAILAIILVIVLILCGFIISLIRDAFWTDTDEAKLIYIPQGAGIGQIAQLLAEEQIIDYPLFFRIYEKIGKSQIYHSGVHTFYVGQSYGEALKALTKASENTIMLTIPEGYEMRQIAQLLEDNGVCTKADFYEASKGEFPDFPYLKDISREENLLEGYLFPDTYEFEKNQGGERAIKAMLNAFNEKVYSIYTESGTSRSLDEIIIMASIIEREAASDSERGKVASVFYNRLEKGMKLQSCATVQYIIEERKDILSNSDIKIDSPYNTYMYEGLPVGPIASPGVNSVKSALYPEETDYFYFAATKDGSRNVFSKTGEEHIKTVKELQ